MCILDAYTSAREIFLGVSRSDNFFRNVRVPEKNAEKEDNKTYLFVIIFVILLLSCLLFMLVGFGVSNFRLGHFFGFD